MSDFSRTYTRSKKKKRVDESEGDPNMIELFGASSGPILRPRMYRASQPIVDEIVEEGHETSSNDDEESDDDYRMQFSQGKGPANDDDDEEDYGGRERGVEEKRKKKSKLCLILEGQSIPALIAL
jgi:hypothetical protein